MEKKKVLKNIQTEKHIRFRKRFSVSREDKGGITGTIVKRDGLEETVEQTENKKAQRKKKKNNKENIEDMDKLNKVQDILDDKKLPERKVRIEKAEKGLFERTSNSTLLLTEDNKLMLTD